MLYRCPTDPSLSSIHGCGHVFRATPDSEGLIDCPACGIWYNPDENYRDPNPDSHKSTSYYRNPVPSDALLCLIVDAYTVGLVRQGVSRCTAIELAAERCVSLGSNPYLGERIARAALRHLYA